MNREITDILRLYVTGQTPNSVMAIQNLNKILSDLSDKFKDMHELMVIDILENPQLAKDERILATPTLTRVFGGSIKRVIGDLSNREKVLSELGLI